MPRRSGHWLVLCLALLAAREPFLRAMSPQTVEYRVTVPTGRFCVICDFPWPTNDSNMYPIGATVGISLIAEGPAGDVFGTSQWVGAMRLGSIFRATRGGQRTLLHSFDGKNGAQPEGGLVQVLDAGGNPTGRFFGTTLLGGSRNAGTIFRFDASGAALDVLYNFRNGDTAGMPTYACPKPPATTPGCQADSQTRLNAMASYPNAAPVMVNGQLYGIAPIGQTSRGVLYTLSPEAPTPPAPTPGGSSPVPAPDNNLRALCTGGALAKGQLLSSALLFATCTLDGVLRNAASTLIAGNDGTTADPTVKNVLYVTVPGGTWTNLHGAIFQAELNGSTKALHIFTASPNGSALMGSAPMGVIQASDGNLYGTTFRGGAVNGGVVFRLRRMGTAWNYEVLTHLGQVLNDKGINGINAAATVVEGMKRDHEGRLVSDRHVYGVTKTGPVGAGNGIIFRVSMDGGDDPKVLHVFPIDSRKGMFPNPLGRLAAAPLLLHSDGHFYGTTTQGGSINAGVLFQLSGVNLELTNAVSTIHTVVGNLNHATIPGPFLAKASVLAAKDDIVEVRTGETTGQVNASCPSLRAANGICVTQDRTDDQIRIDVKNCRNAHVVQFIRRHERLLSDDSLVPGDVGPDHKCLYGTNQHTPYSTETWRTDASCGKPNAFLDQNPGSARAYAINPGGPAVTNQTLTVWDQPTVAGPADQRSSADVKDFVFCDCKPTRVVRWTRMRAGLAPPVYTAISILPPTADDVAWMHKQLETDGYHPVPGIPLFQGGKGIMAFGTMLGFDRRTR